MKVIGIDIDKTKAIVYALEQNVDDSITNVTGNFTSLTLANHLDSKEVKRFTETISSYFRSINPDLIAIISRASKGKFAASPISFKIEGLIQCYEELDIEFVPQLTLTAYYKKNDFNISTQYIYQTSAAQLANYLILRV